VVPFRVKLPPPVTVPMPIMQANNPQHPQIKADAMVAIMPVFLLFMFSPLF
jgi:hypothetical protein